VVNAAGHRAAELVGPRSFREKFDRGFFTFFELPTFIALRRRELETGKAGRIGAVGNDRAFEAVISVRGGDFEPNPHSPVATHVRRREFVLPPPAGATRAELVQFGQQHYAGVLWGAWLQAVGPVFIMLFAFSLVHLAGATQRLAGWMALSGATILMTVSLIEITYYISALFPDPQMMTSISLRVISAVQHLYFIVAAPAVFLPLGIILVRSTILPRIFGYLALILAAAFAALGAVFMLRLALPAWVTAFAAVQGIWRLAAGIALMIHSGPLARESRVAG